MKSALSTLVITLGLTLAGQAAAGTTCNTVQNGNHIYQQCFQTTAIHTWNTPKETISHTANPIFTTDRDGTKLSGIEQSGFASRQESGSVTTNGSSRTITTEKEHVVKQIDY